MRKFKPILALSIGVLLISTVSANPDSSGLEKKFKDSRPKFDSEVRGCTIGDEPEKDGRKLTPAHNLLVRNLRKSQPRRVPPSSDALKKMIAYTKNETKDYVEGLVDIARNLAKIDKLCSEKLAAFIKEYEINRTFLPSPRLPKPFGEYMGSRIEIDSDSFADLEIRLSISKLDLLTPKFSDFIKIQEDITFDSLGLRTINQVDILISRELDPKKKLKLEEEIVFLREVDESLTFLGVGSPTFIKVITSDPEKIISDFPDHVRSYLQDQPIFKRYFALLKKSHEAFINDAALVEKYDQYTGHEEYAKYCKDALINIPIPNSDESFTGKPPARNTFLINRFKEDAATRLLLNQGNKQFPGMNYAFLLSEGGELREIIPLLPKKNDVLLKHPSPIILRETEKLNSLKKLLASNTAMDDYNMARYLDCPALEYAPQKEGDLLRYADILGEAYKYQEAAYVVEKKKLEEGPTAKKADKLSVKTKSE